MPRLSLMEVLQPRQATPNTGSRRPRRPGGKGVLAASLLPALGLSGEQVGPAHTPGKGAP